MLKLVERMAAFDVSCPHGRRGSVCARSVAAVVRQTLMRSSEQSVPYRGSLEGNLVASARPAVMVGDVASVCDSSLLLPALRTPAPIRAPPRRRPLLP
jgi:hypothetical protein